MIQIIAGTPHIKLLTTLFTDSIVDNILSFLSQRANTVWAGLLIAVGNEYVKSNPKPVREKRKAVEALCAQPEFAKAIRELRPKGLGRNKQIVADLIGSGRFGTLTALYRLKNHM